MTKLELNISKFPSPIDHPLFHPPSQQSQLSPIEEVSGLDLTLWGSAPLFADFTTISLNLTHLELVAKAKHLVGLQPLTLPNLLTIILHATEQQSISSSHCGIQILTPGLENTQLMLSNLRCINFRESMFGPTLKQLILLTPSCGPPIADQADQAGMYHQSPVWSSQQFMEDYPMLEEAELECTCWTQQAQICHMYVGQC